MKRLICHVFGHDFGTDFTQPEERFEKRWAEALGEAIPMEVFLHTCKRCADRFKVTRWTRAAMMKLADDQSASAYERGWHHG